MINILIIIVYLAIIILIGVQLYEDQSLMNRRDRSNIFWLIIGTGIWPIAIIIAVIYERYLELNSKE